MTLLEILRARRRIRTHVRRTPLATSRTLSRRVGADVLLKLETAQVTNSFKLRGAFNAVSALLEREGRRSRIVSASAGNHGRGLAHVCAELGVEVTIFTPRDAPRAKLDAIAASGAELRAIGQDYDDAERQALQFAAASGARYVSAYNDPDVIAGAGTIGIEILEDAPDVDLVIVPLGGGGLLAGVAAAVKGAAPGVRVIGVEAEASQPFAAALRAGKIVTVDVGPTLADGLAGNLQEGSSTFELVRDLADGVAAVSESAIRQAIRLLVAEERVIAEGAGAVGVAALLSGAIRPTPDSHVAVVVSGGNIDAEKLAGVMSAMSHET